jgi:voltage-gated potassium channel Kch
MVLSLLLAPLIVHFSDRLVFRFVASEWLLRSMQLTQIAAQSLTSDKHAILCGYGRTGQHLARFLEAEGVSFMALDLDPERVREATAAGGVGFLRRWLAQGNPAGRRPVPRQRGDHHLRRHRRRRCA